MNVKKEYNSKIWNNENIQFLKENYPKYGVKYCSEKLSLSYSQIRSKCSKLGLTLNKEVRFRLFKESCNLRNYSESIDSSRFIDCRESESAYILGILWADGYLNNKSQYNRICLEIVEKDGCIIKQLFDKYGKWLIYTRPESFKNGIKRQSRMSIQCCNRNLFNFLVDNDYNQKSLYTPRAILDKLDDKLHQYW